MWTGAVGTAQLRALRVPTRPPVDGLPPGFRAPSYTSFGGSGPSPAMYAIVLAGVPGNR